MWTLGKTSLSSNRDISSSKAVCLYNNHIYSYTMVNVHLKWHLSDMVRQSGNPRLLYDILKSKQNKQTCATHKIIVNYVINTQYPLIVMRKLVHLAKPRCLQLPIYYLCRRRVWKTIIFSSYNTVNVHWKWHLSRMVKRSCLCDLILSFKLLL